MDILILAEFSEIFIIFEKGVGDPAFQFNESLIIDREVRFVVKLCRSVPNILKESLKFLKSCFPSNFQNIE